MTDQQDNALGTERRTRSGWTGGLLLFAMVLFLAPLHAAPAAATEPSREALLELRAAGAFEPALAMAETLLENAPDDADLLLLKGQLQAFLERHEAALETLAKAASLAPDYLDVRLMQARVHLFAAAPDRALAVLEPVVPASLERVDAQLLLGRAALAAGRPELARHAFARAAEQSPTSGDAWLGLGDTALETGSVTVAQLNFERALAVPDTAPVARARLDALADAQRRFELVTDVSASRFNDPSDDWLETSTSLGWRLDDRRQLTTGVAVAHRFAKTDVQLATTWSARLDERSGYLLGAAVAPGADFLPSWLIRAGYDRKLYDLGGVEPLPGLDLGVGVGILEGSLAHYEDGLVQGFDAGIVQYGWQGRAWLTAKAGGSFGTDGDFDPSFGLRLDLQVTPETRAFFGFGQAFDNSDQGTGTTQSFFTGLDHALNERLGLIATLALEDRENGVRRTTVSLGVRVRF
jgi:YaiO family outer membrane protein